MAVREPEAILASIVEDAQRATSAQGAALALLVDGTAFCRSRSGDLSPPIDAELIVDSGVAAECLRTGEPFRSDERSCDDRVNQQVGRELGLRSVAMAALRNHFRTLRVLEVFSCKAGAFNDQDLNFLALLAATAALALPDAK